LTLSEILQQRIYKLTTKVPKILAGAVRQLAGRSLFKRDMPLIIFQASCLSFINAMKYSLGFLGGCMAHLALASSVTATTAATALPTPRYRISPIDGSTIALPTQEQLDFQSKEFGVLIHFEMGTYLDIDGCNNVPTLVPNLTLFDPTLLNTDQWMDTITALGAKYATLVAKHNCGFTTWPSKVKFQTRDNTTIAYNYTIAQSPVSGDDMVGSFVASAKKYNIGHGFYYSTVVNNFLNVQNSKVNATSWSVGQVRITNNTYDEIVEAQLTELWTNYGIGTVTEVSRTQFVFHHTLLSISKRRFD
jgi:alpha-L-fucosidase